MANLGSADITYTIVKIKKLEDGRKIVNAKLAFGDGAKLYPVGGIPLLVKKLGFAVQMESCSVEDIGSIGYLYSFDHANVKLKIFEDSGVADTAFNELTNAIAPAANTIQVTAIGY